MDANRFATEWVAAWNSHDLERILSHYADGIEFTSPVAARLVPESGGNIKGLVALRAYWAKGLAILPDLHFDLLQVLESVNGVTLLYRNQRGQLVTETFFFDERVLVVRSSAAYAAIAAPEPSLGGCSYVLVARIPPAGVEAFNGYEDGVLPLLKALGGRLDRRLRSRDGSTEVHVVWFPTDLAFRTYRDDPRRSELAPLLLQSEATLELLELEDHPSHAP